MFTSKKSKGIIRRMKEIWKMWCIMRYLIKHHNHFVVWSIQNIGSKEDATIEELYQGHFQRSLELLKRSKEPRIRRIELALLFSTKQYWKENILIFPIHQSFLPKKENEHLIKKRNFQNEIKTNDVQSTIDSCIKLGFIGKDENSKDLIFLTLEGKKFGDVFCVGLVSAWLKELSVLATELGAWKQTGLGALFTTIIFIILKLLGVI